MHLRQMLQLSGLRNLQLNSQKAHSDLQKELDTYRSLYESLPFPYFILNTIGGVIAVNSSGASYLGYTQNELLEKTISFLVHQDDQELVQTNLERLINAAANSTSPKLENTLQKAHLPWNFRQLCKDGKIRWVKAMARVIQLPISLLPLILLICEDITERHQIEEELHSVSAALDHAGEGISRLDEQGRYIMVNQAYADAVGYEPAEMIGMSWTPTVHPDALEMAIAAYQHMLTHGKAEVEVRGQRKNGSVFYKKVVMVAARDQQQLIGHYCFMQDITSRKQAELALRHAHDQLERKIAERTAELSQANHQLQDEVAERQRIEQALRESEERYRCIVETATEGIWILDQNHQTSFVNRKMEGLLGYDNEEMQGQSLFDFMDAEGQTIAKHLLKRRHQGIKEKHDFKFCRKDGSPLWAIVSASPMFNSVGQYIGVLGMVTDITERKQAELALRESEERYRSVVTAIHEGIVLQDREGSICACNASAERILGLSAQEMMGRNSDDPRCQAIREDGSLFLGEEHPAMVTLQTGQPCSNVVMGLRKSADSVT